MTDERPFADVRFTNDGLSIPSLKWRELIFTGALREIDGCFVRDATRPLAPFEAGDLFPAGLRFVASRVGDRMLVRRVDSEPTGRGE